jgi:hypothetical protein
MSDTYRDLAVAEIGVIRQQAPWLYAFSRGIMDIAPLAAQALDEQARILADEADAADRRLAMLDKT